MLESAEKYLREQEWSMGNGQCPECFGLGPNTNWGDDRKVGHNKGCLLAAALREIYAAMENVSDH